MRHQILQLRKVYDNNVEQFIAYDEIYSIARRLGYQSAETAWLANPKYVIDLRSNTLIKLSKLQAKKYKYKINLG